MIPGSDGCTQLAAGIEWNHAASRRLKQSETAYLLPSPSIKAVSNTRRLLLIFLEPSGRLATDGWDLMELCNRVGSRRLKPSETAAEYYASSFQPYGRSASVASHLFLLLLVDS